MSRCCSVCNHNKRYLLCCCYLFYFALCHIMNMLQALHRSILSKLFIQLKKILLHQINYHCLKTFFSNSPWESRKKYVWPHKIWTKARINFLSIQPVSEVKVLSNFGALGNPCFIEWSNTLVLTQAKHPLKSTSLNSKLMGLLW